MIMMRLRRDPADDTLGPDATGFQVQLGVYTYVRSFSPSYSRSVVVVAAAAAAAAVVVVVAAAAAAVAKVQYWKRSTTVMRTKADQGRVVVPARVQQP